MASEKVVGLGRDAEHRFFGGMAVAILLTAIFGFSRTYFLRSLLPAPSAPLPSLSPLIHVHGALFTGWVVLLVVQARLAATKRLGLHRRLGALGVSLALAMVVVGVLTAIRSVARGIGPFGMDPRRFLLVPLTAILLFGGFFFVAIWKRRDPQSHKRLILLGTIALLPPALARWILLLGLGPPFILGFSILFVVPLVVWDLKSRGRLHPVTLWGGLLVLISVPLRFALAQTDSWIRLAEWLARSVN